MQIQKILRIISALPTMLLAPTTTATIAIPTAIMQRIANQLPALLIRHQQDLKD